jgi:signal transduction histidine kinase
VVRNYKSLLAEVVDPYTNKINPKHQALTVEIDPETPPTQIYPEHFVKSLQALIDNALKFGRENERREKEFNDVTLRVMPMLVGDDEHAQECVCFEVSDSGRGIAHAEFSKIFDVFYQINRKEFEDQGVGVGLAIVKGIVEAHNGEVGVESTPGAGSTFFMLLPAYRN